MIGQVLKAGRPRDTVAPVERDQARKAAEDRLRQQASVKRTVGGFLITIVASIVIWALTGQGYFWPVWVILGLGLATAGMAWSAYGPREKTPSQAEVEEEARKFEDR